MANAKKGGKSGAKARNKASRKAGSQAGSRASTPTEMLLVSSKVRQMLKEANVNTAGDALEGLNAYVGWLIDQAARRATENGRKTVRAHDFMIF